MKIELVQSITDTQQFPRNVTHVDPTQIHRVSTESGRVEVRSWCYSGSVG